MKNTLLRQYIEETFGAISNVPEQHSGADCRFLAAGELRQGTNLSHEVKVGTKFAVLCAWLWP
jgi:hypothetical protein